MSTKSFILFITGTSASGKTTLYQSLRDDSKLSAINFHDIDENGVPPVARGPWREFRVEELLYEAVLRFEKGESTIVCGISKPHEIIESTYFKPRYNVHFLLIEVPYSVIKARIEERVENQPKIGVFDEVFNPDAVQETLIGNKKLLRELQNSISQQKNGRSLNVERLTKEQMHDEVLKIIEHIQG